MVHMLTIPENRCRQRGQHWVLGKCYTGCCSPTWRSGPALHVRHFAHPQRPLCRDLTTKVPLSHPQNDQEKATWDICRCNHPALTWQLSRISGSWWFTNVSQGDGSSSLCLTRTEWGLHHQWGWHHHTDSRKQSQVDWSGSKIRVISQTGDVQWHTTVLCRLLTRRGSGPSESAGYAGRRGGPGLQEPCIKATCRSWTAFLPPRPSFQTQMNYA